MPCKRSGVGGAIALADLVRVMVFVVAFFIFAASIELSERVARWGLGYERWQLDELPLTLLVLSIGLAWFAFRRVREAQSELQERVRAEARIGELLEHNRDLSQRLILAQENERRALARELHDEFGQNCTAIRAEAAFIQHAESGDRSGIAAGAERISQAAESLHLLVRGMLGRLRPPALDSLGLEAALQEYCESWELQSGIACGFFPRNIPPSIDDATSITVFRLVQESLTNVSRHSGADQVRITLGAEGESLSLRVEDNGRGMAHPDVPHAGFGILGMHERVAGLHGNIRFFRSAGGGLCIDAELPLIARAT